MRTKSNSNICLFFEHSENGVCKHYGGKEDKREACFSKCKKIKKKKVTKKTDTYITGMIVE